MTSQINLYSPLSSRKSVVGINSTNCQIAVCMAAANKTCKETFDERNLSNYTYLRRFNKDHDGFNYDHQIFVTGDVNEVYKKKVLDTQNEADFMPAQKELVAHVDSGLGFSCYLSGEDTKIANYRGGHVAHFPMDGGVFFSTCTLNLAKSPDGKVQESAIKEAIQTLEGAIAMPEFSIMEMSHFDISYEHSFIDDVENFEFVLKDKNYFVFDGIEYFDNVYDEKAERYHPYKWEEKARVQFNGQRFAFTSFVKTTFTPFFMEWKIEEAKSALEATGKEDGDHGLLGFIHYNGIVICAFTY